MKCPNCDEEFPNSVGLRMHHEMAHLMERRPAEAFPVGDYLTEELDARGWSLSDLVEHMPGNQELNRRVAADLLSTPLPGIRVSVDMAERLAVALGTDAEFWLNLDRVYQEANSHG